MAKNLSEQLTDFMKNYRKAQDEARTFEGMQTALSNMLINNVNSTAQETKTAESKPVMSEGLKKTLENTNTLVEAIRKNALNKNILEGDKEEEDVIEYTYKPGDSFGQVIKNLGLQTDNGLWGPNGDVAYYTQQLAEQGAMNSRGNIPIGTTIRLVRRK